MFTEVRLALLGKQAVPAVGGRAPFPPAPPLWITFSLHLLFVSAAAGLTYDDVS